MARLISYPTISTVASGDLFPVTDISNVNKPLKNITAVDLQTFVNDGATLQRVISTGNTYQGSSGPLWTWGDDGTLTATSSIYTALMNSKGFKTTVVADGAYIQVQPNQIVFNTALGNTTSITSNTALSSGINLQLPSSSGTLALTSDITSSPWDTITGGINYAGGNVGVGATNPGAKLHVEAAGIGARIVSTTNTGLEVLASGLGAKIVSSNTTALDVQGGMNSQDIAKFKNNSGSVKFVIDTNGNVGIGTTSPVSPLTVKSNSVSSGESGIVIQANGNTNSIIKLGERANDGARLEMLDAGVTKIALFTDGTDNYINAGNVGIGTTSPQSAFKLDVNGNVKAGGSAYVLNDLIHYGSSDFNINASDGSTNIKFKAGSSEKMCITSSGNVGIGTTSPNNKLVVSGVDTNSELDGTTVTQAALQLSNSDEAYGTFFGTLSTGAGLIQQRRRATEVYYPVAINPYGGNVGIGTPSPTSKLDVAGGDIELNDAAAGIIMKSPDGTKYRITVANGGTLTVTAV
jgi:hypothetical protein